MEVEPQRAVYIGVDVGTGSARAAAVTGQGEVVGHDSVAIAVHNPLPDHYEQDSNEIWQAVCQAVQAVVAKLEPSDRIKGLGFDATCSLVVLDEDMKPLTVDTKTGESRWNIVMWMDHRAKQETQLINTKPHDVLQYVGGSMSLEMQTPKLLWLKRHLPDTWSKAAHFFDLPDFLTSKATGNLTRSLCSLVCKWTYVHDSVRHGWDKTFFGDIGLEDLMKDDCAKIGKEVLPPGSVCGTVTPQMAAELGVPPHTPVATSLIDAHAGALALIGARGKGGPVTGKLAIISGTSSCHLICSDTSLSVKGVWGPYYEALLPKCWLAEAGQSATGALCDHVRDVHPACDVTIPRDSLPQWVEDQVQKLAEENGLEDPATLTKSLHVYPDHHGNRAPLADPRMRGMVSGLSLECGKEDLALQYLATVQALAYGSRDIIESLKANGHKVTTVMICGGLAQSKLYTQTHADVLGVEVSVPSNQQLSVVVGAAMLGAAAAHGGDVIGLLHRMAGATHCSQPNSNVSDYHEKKYRVYKKMQSDQLAYRQIMEQSVLCGSLN